MAMGANAFTEDMRKSEEPGINGWPHQEARVT